jgi:hypothetical protein
LFIVRSRDLLPMTAPGIPNENAPKEKVGGLAQLFTD